MEHTKPPHRLQSHNLPTIDELVIKARKIAEIIERYGGMRVQPKQDETTKGAGGLESRCYQLGPLLLYLDGKINLNLTIIGKGKINSNLVSELYSEHIYYPSE